MRIGDPCFTSPPHVVLSPADGGGFFADVGFISRGWAQINQIFWNLVPMDSSRQWFRMADGYHPPVGTWHATSA